MSRRRRPKLPPGHRTVRDVRQVLSTGTVADVAALAPPRPDTDHITLKPPKVVITPFNDSTVEAAIAFVDKTGIAEFVDAEYANMKQKAGRPNDLSTRAVLVGMQLSVRDTRPLLVTEIRTILYRRLSPPMRRLLDIPNDPCPKEQAALRKWNWRTAAVVGRTFHRILAPIDPSVMPKNRILSAEAAEKLKRNLSVDEQHLRLACLDWATGQVLESSYQQVPKRVRDRHQEKTPSYCIDGTPLPLFARGQALSSGYISADPDAGWYIREEDHGDPAEQGLPSTKKGKGLFKRSKPKVIWARDIHLIVTADASHPTRLYMPGGLPLAATSDVPGRDPAGAARRLFANLNDRGHKPGPLAGDILYTNQDEEKYQTPARESGYDLVLGYGVKQIGVQGAHSSGALLLEGMCVAPCVPDDLATATDDLRAKRITLKEYGAFIKARTEYRMRTKEAADPAKGVKERLTCPAAGPNPIAMCALKPKSTDERATRQPDGALVDVRRMIDHRKVLTNGEAPTVCQQETITLTPKDGAKFRQSLPFGSQEHTTLYNRLRQSQEGVHGTAKDEAGVALADPGRRRVRGWAAQQLFAAFLLAETATRRIYRFLTDAVPDRNGDLYVDRRLRSNSGADSQPTGSPPGAPPVIEDDPPQAA